MSRRSGVALGLALFFCLAACASDPPGLSPDRPPLRVGWALWSGWYPMAIAMERKLFEKHGARIEPVFYDAYSNLVPDFASGRLDGAFSGLYELLKSGTPGQKVVLVTDNSDGAEGLVVAPGIEKPQDLVGKRVGIQGGLSGGEFITITMLRRSGLLREDFQFVDVEPEQVLDYLPDRIQAGYTWDPFVTQARARGYGLLFTTADIPGMIPDVVAFQGEVVRNRAADVRAFVDAWFEAVSWWRQHPDEGRAVIAKATGLALEEVSLVGCRLFDRQDNIRAFTPGNDHTSLYFTARKQVEFFTGVGDTSRATNLDAVLDPSFVR